MLLVWLQDQLTVSVPKRLLIQNRALAILLRSIQVILLVGVTAYCITTKIWLKHAEPKAWNIILKGAKPPIDGHEGHGGSWHHCSNPRAYWYNRSNPSLQFRPQGCEDFATSREFWWSNGDEGRLFIPTHVQEKNIWQQAHGNCSSSLALQCEAIGGQQSRDHNRYCLCTQTKQFLMRNPEEQWLMLHHGYSVLLTKQVQAVPRRESTDTPRHNVQSGLGGIETLIEAVDGSSCQVGGRSTWTHADASGGILGTLGQWLACAGIRLDERPDANALGGSEQLAPHFRTMGLELQLNLHYTNDHPYAMDNKVLCILTVNAHVQWTFMPVVHDQLHIPGSEGAIMAERLQVAHGVSFAVHVTGDYNFFSIVATVESLLKLFVLFQIPIFFVRLVALYSLGSLSKMYRRATSTQFSIYNSFHCGIARMLLAEVAFRGLVGGAWNNTLAGTYLSLARLSSHVNDLLYHQVRNRILTSEDATRIAAVVMSHMSGKSGQSVSCDEFVRACSQDEIFDMDLLTEVLKDMKRAPPVQRVFKKNAEALRKSLGAVEVGMALGPQSTLSSEVSSIDMSILPNGPLWSPGQTQDLEALQKEKEEEEEEQMERNADPSRCESGKIRIDASPDQLELPLTRRELNEALATAQHDVEARLEQEMCRRFAEAEVAVEQKLELFRKVIQPFMETELPECTMSSLEFTDCAFHRHSARWWRRRVSSQVVATPREQKTEATPVVDGTLSTVLQASIGMNINEAQPQHVQEEKEQQEWQDKQEHQQEQQQKHGQQGLQGSGQRVFRAWPRRRGGVGEQEHKARDNPVVQVIRNSCPRPEPLELEISTSSPRSVDVEISTPSPVTVASSAAGISPITSQEQSRWSADIDSFTASRKRLSREKSSHRSVGAERRESRVVTFLPTSVAAGSGGGSRRLPPSCLSPVHDSVHSA